MRAVSNSAILIGDGVGKPLGLSYHLIQEFPTKRQPRSSKYGATSMMVLSLSNATFSWLAHAKTLRVP